MNTARAHDLPNASRALRLPGAIATRVVGRRAIEDYVDRLNRASPVADRRIEAWADAAPDELAIGAVGGPQAGALATMGLAECRLGFALATHTREGAVRAGSAVIGLPLTGAISALSRGREIEVRAGHGLVLDPADVAWSRVAPGTHFIEFTVPAATMQRLAADWLPGAGTGRPRLAPLMTESLARRLVLMVSEVAAVGQAGGTAEAAAGSMARDLVGRWTELIALTLLHEQPLADERHAPPPARDARGAAGAASVRRAVDFIHAHADSAIGIADIADAACVSARTLLRHFAAQRGETPIDCLPRARLEGARAELRARPELTVRDIAWKWGFQNASKFSHAYRRLFGETPGATRRG